MSESEGVLLSTVDGNLSTPREGRAALRAEVVRGLAATPPRLPPKLFYDEAGALLFEEITSEPEYYPTRTEIGILHQHLPEMARWVGARARVVEFGSGSGEKTRWLLESLDRPLSYTPVDIAAAQLEETAGRLRALMPSLIITPVVADYTRPFALPRAAGDGEMGAARGENADDDGAAVLFFPGSTIGNFEPDEALRFLARAGATLGVGARLLIGVDRVKSRELLEAAYNDAEGVTARFNLNALTHLNRELGSDFDVERFEHRAVWNSAASRIEMHLVAKEAEAQRVTIPPLAHRGESARGLESSARYSRTFEPGQFIVTEHSYKYTRERFEALLAAAGWIAESCWVDAQGWFAVHAAVWRPDPNE